MSLPQIFEMYRGDDFNLKVGITDSKGMPVDTPAAPSLP